MSRKFPPKTSPIASTNEPWPMQALTFLTVALLVIILVQCVVGQLPDLNFDTDPRTRSIHDAVVTFGPVGSAWLSTICVILTAAILLVHPLAGGTIDWISLLLVGGGLIASLHHLPRQSDNFYYLGSWIGAACAGISAAHLGQFLRFRRWIIAAFIAMLPALGFAAINYVLVEHPMTVNYHREHLQEFLQAHGWTEQAPQYQLYLRRIIDPQVTGVFGLSNIFGSILAAMTAATCAIAASLLWQKISEKKLAWKWTLLPVGVLLLGSVSVVLTRSKGAAAALVLSVFIMLFFSLFGRIAFLKNPQSRSRWFIAGIVAILCVMLPIGAVIYRGKTWQPTPGPNAKHHGDISLLVRAQYWQAALGMFKNPPASTPIHVENGKEEFQKSAVMGNRFWGLSPGGFGEAYLRYKSPLNPEEVSSTHNVFIDSIIMLGLGGLCWSLLLLLWLWRGAENIFSDEQQDFQENASPNSPWILPLILAFGVFGTQYYMQWALMASGVVIWMLGAIGFVLVLRVLLASPATDVRNWRLAAFLAALVLLIHNQIEMAFFQASSAPVVWFIVGLAGAKTLVLQPKTTTTVGSLAMASSLRANKILFVPAVVFILFWGALFAKYTLTAMEREEALAEAAAQLVRGNLPVAQAKLQELAESGPLDLRVVRWAAQVRMEEAQDLLRQGQWQKASETSQSANAIVQSALDRGMDNTGIHRLLAQLIDRQNKLLDQTPPPRVNFTAYRSNNPLPSLARVTWLTPYSISDWMDYTQALEQRNACSTAELLKLYEHILELSDAAYLDHAKQLNEEERRAVEQRVLQLKTQR